MGNKNAQYEPGESISRVQFIRFPEVKQRARYQWPAIRRLPPHPHRPMQAGYAHPRR